MGGGAASRGKSRVVLVLLGAAVINACRREAPRPAGQAVAWSWPVERPVDLCLEKCPAGTDLRADTEANLRIEGRLVALGGVPPDGGTDFRTVIACSDDPARYVDVVDDEGQTWRIAYHVSGPVTPEVRAPIGARVQFDFDAAFYSGKLARFALVDQLGPVLAIAQGSYTPDGRLGLPLVIAWGPSFAERGDDMCGDEVLRALSVRGDREVAVAPGQVATIERQGRRFRFWNAQSIAVRPPPCPDQDDAVSWVLWRE